MLQDAKGGDGDSVAGAVVPMFAVARKMPERKKKKEFVRCGFQIVALQIAEPTVRSIHFHAFCSYSYVLKMRRGHFPECRCPVHIGR